MPRSRQDVDLDDLGRAPPVVTPGRDEDLATFAVGKDSAHRSGVFGVVGHHHPSVVVGEPGPHLSHGVTHAGRRRSQPQLPPQRRQVVLQRGRLLGPEPPHHVEVVAVGIGVLHRQTGLTHAAGAGEGMGGDRGAGPSSGDQGVEHGPPAHEVGEPIVGDVPYGRRPSGTPRNHDNIPIDVKSLESGVTSVGRSRH